MREESKVEIICTILLSQKKLRNITECCDPVVMRLFSDDIEISKVLGARHCLSGAPLQTVQRYSSLEMEKIMICSSTVFLIQQRVENVHDKSNQRIYNADKI